MVQDYLAVTQGPGHLLFCKVHLLFQGKERRIGIPLRMQVFSWCCSYFEAGSDAKGSFFPLGSLFSFLDSFLGSEGLMKGL